VDEPPAALDAVEWGALQLLATSRATMASLAASLFWARFTMA
jgi:hypothetical protein